MASNYLNPLSTKLDAAQIIRRAYDEPNNRIRVDAQVTATIGTVAVVIDAASGDNIAISDGTHTLVISPDGGITVHQDDLSHINDSVRLGNGTQFISSTPRKTGEVGIDTNQINRVFSKAFDEIEVTTKNDDGDPTTIVTRLNSSLIQTAIITYDADGDFQKIEVS